MIGPGKYDDLCTKVREEAGALGVILIVVQGDKGGGFSCQLPLDVMLCVPEILRDIAQQIEGDRAKGEL
jgi:NAD(P)H-dependent flavin oxidoreductase YrpB (nitropropane dioxygenase family)